MTMNTEGEILEVKKLPGSKAKVVVKKQPPVCLFSPQDYSDNYSSFASPSANPGSDN
jgi:hypothetical protein